MGALKKYSLFLLAVLLLASCRTPQQLAAKAERERRERAAKEEKARQERLQLLEDMRKAFPCDTSTSVKVITRTVKGDSVPCPPGEAKVKCPDVKVMDTTITNTVVDSSMLQSYKDRLEAALYQISLRDQYIEDAKKDYADLRRAHADEVKRAETEEAEKKKWRNRCLWGGGAIVGGVLLWLLLAGKFSFITGLIKKIV